MKARTEEAGERRGGERWICWRRLVASLRRASVDASASRSGKAVEGYELLTESLLRVGCQADNPDKKGPSLSSQEELCDGAPRVRGRPVRDLTLVVGHLRGGLARRDDRYDGGEHVHYGAENGMVGGGNRKSRERSSRGSGLVLR